MYPYQIPGQKTLTETSKIHKVYIYHCDFNEYKSYLKKSLFCISLQFTISHLAGARSSSQRLRGDVDNLITQCANDMWSAWNTTNTALQQVMPR